jgi:dynactin complex subunit
VKDLLIQPFYTEENEGRRLKYVIDMKDNFLAGSVIIKNLKEADLVKEYMEASFIPTELLYRATKDGF